MKDKEVLIQILYVKTSHKLSILVYFPSKTYKAFDILRTLKVDLRPWRMPKLYQFCCDPMYGENTVIGFFSETEETVGNAIKQT